MRYISFVFLFVVNLGWSQTNELYTKYKSLYPDEAAVYLERSELLTILLEKDTLRGFTEITEDLLILKDQAETFSGRKVYGSSFNNVRDLTANTLVWDKGKYKTLAVKDFTRNSERGQSIFFDDSYNIAFNFPAITAQCRTQLHYFHDMKDIRFMDGFVFATYIPQAKASFTIKAAKGVELYFNVRNDPKKSIQFNTYEKGGFVFYEWTVTNADKMKVEEDSPAIQYFAPQVVAYVKSFQTKQGRKNVINSADDLYRWYYTFIKHLNKTATPELLDIVASLKSKSKNELDLVKNTFYWVQDNIQYIAFEQGMRGLIPHSGGYVCEKRFGDCKDMANLIVHMLRLANVNAYHTWIGTRDIPFQYSEIPTPLVDNHMIATYIDASGRYYFLDATDHYVPFGFPTSMIQGKEALIGFDSVRYQIKPVPVVEPQQNKAVDSVRVSLEGNYIVGVGNNATLGFVKSFSAYRLNRTDVDDVKKSVARMLGKGSNKFFLDKYTVKNTAEKDLPTQIAYEFRIGDYFQRVGDEIYLNLNLRKDYYDDFINVDDRKTPRENEFHFSQLDVFEFQIPAGYEVSYLPPNSKLNNPLMDCSIEYQHVNDKIIYRKSLQSKSLLVKPDQFSVWNEAITHISDAYRESIILKKK